jgi:hypothetical protein
MNEQYRRFRRVQALGKVGLPSSLKGPSTSRRDVSRFTALGCALVIAVTGSLSLICAPAASAAANAAVESSSDWGSSTGYRWFAGSVRNVGDVSLDSVKVRLNFYDAGNALVGTDYTYVDESVVAPGTLGSYQTVATVPPTYDHTVAIVEAAERYSWSTKQATRNYSVSLTNTYSDGYTTHYVGTVTNLNTFATDSVTVHMIFRDLSERVVGSEYTYVGFGSNHSLGAGQTATFEITRTNSHPAASTYNIYGDAAYTPSAPPAPPAPPAPVPTPPNPAPVLQPTLTAGLTATAVPVRGAAALMGTVTPYAGTVLTLKRKNGAAWTTVASRTIPASASNGRYSFALPTATSSLTTYAVTASGRGLTPATSKSLVLATYSVAIRSVRAAGDQVALRNSGRVAVSLAGWKLKDASGKALVLPRRTVPAGGSLTIFTGKGRSTATKLYLGRAVDLWSKHDTAKLLNASGALVAQRKY